MTDLQAAAERVRLIRSGKSLPDVYETMAAQPMGTLRAEYEIDLERIADAYLASIAADDEEPVTTVMIGHGYDGWDTLIQLEVTPHNAVIRFTSFGRTISYEAIHKPTRCAVRRLAAALGITLQEKHDAE